MKRKNSFPTTIAVIIIIFSIILFLIIWISNKKQDTGFDINNPTPMQYIFPDGDWTDLTIIIEDKNATSSEQINNRDICYDLIYLPDKDFADVFVLSYYFFNEKQFGLFGEKFSGLSGEQSFKLYRTNGKDKIRIEFYDGINDTEELPLFPSVNKFFYKSNRINPLYSCYFDGKLRATGLSYEQLKNYVCDDYKRECKR